MSDEVVVTRPTKMKDNEIVFVETPAEGQASQPESVIPATQSESVIPATVSIFSGLGVWKYILIIMVLAFLGFNIFTTLGDVTDSTNKFLAPILSAIGIGVGETVKQTTNIAAKGVKFGADVTANTVDNTVSIMEKSIGSNDVKFNRIDKNDAPVENVANKKIYPLPEPDDATSSTQRNQKSKAGYCYIGEDRGFRSCIKVGEGDKCMSGDIFPSEEICLNPSLRE